MNVLIVHNFYKIPGGEDTVVNNEIKLLQLHGHNVYTYFVNNDIISTNGIINKIKLFRNTKFNRYIKKEIQCIIKKNNIEIVHCHNTFPLISPSIYKYSNEMGCKVFQTIHNFRFLCASADFVKNGKICKECLVKNIKSAVKNKCYHNSYLQTLSWYNLQKNFRRKKLYKYVDKFICLTDFNKEILTDIIPRDKIVVKPNFSFFRNDLTDEGTKNQYLYVGRIENIKGIQTLIDVFSQENMPNLVLCGTGNDYEKFKSLVKTNNILFKGFCTKDTIIEELKKSVALIVPSNWYEGFPMTIAEAMSMGVPVIARNIGNLPYIVKNDYDGIIFNNNDELTQIIIKLINDKDLQNKLSFSAKEYIKNELSPEINYKKLISIYEGK